MKKTNKHNVFTKTLPSLLLSAGIALSVTHSSNAIADPIANTALSRGTLSRVVKRNYPNSKLSKAQIMMAVLALNPKAFKGGNINFMMRNVQLSLPSEDIIAAIPKVRAEALLAKHTRLYRRGKTGNLTPPTFITTVDQTAFKKLQQQNSKQSQQVVVMTEESKKLQNVVARLEAEKEQRDRDLEALEGKIQALKEATNSGAEPTEQGVSLSEKRLREKNEILQQQLIESKSELAENNRTTISLERRLGEVQEQQNQVAANNISEAPLETVDSMTAPANDIIDTTDLSATSDQTQSTGFDFRSLFTWLLPLLAILAGLGLLFKRFFGKKKHSDLNLDEVDDYDFTTPAMTDDQRSDEFLTEVEEPLAETSLEVSIKLDVARAYMEAEDNQSAYEMLQEVLRDGNEAQQVEANQLLAKI